MPIADNGDQSTGGPSSRTNRPIPCNDNAPVWMWIRVQRRQHDKMLTPRSWAYKTKDGVSLRQRRFKFKHHFQQPKSFAEKWISKFRIITPDDFYIIPFGREGIICFFYLLYSFLLAPFFSRHFSLYGIRNGLVCSVNQIEN